jgi:hypothetical protein
MFVLTSFLYHLKSIQKNLARFEATASIDVNTFILNLWGGGKYYQLAPQFFRRADGKVRYSVRLPDDPRGFVGWRPYFNKQWDAALDKLAFKEHCRAKGLCCPAHWTDRPQAPMAFLVKPRRASFSSGIRGPFRAFDPSNPSHQLRENEYYDQFIPGSMGKAWYWNDKPVCVELKEMPTIRGNGKDSSRQLIEEHFRRSSFTPDWDDYADTLEFHGIPLDRVPDEGQVVVADFRYGSMLQVPDWDNHNVVERLRESQLGEELRNAGPLLWEAIPEDLRESSAYTVDFIADRDDHAWFLEMNCNPGIHPDVYPHMLEGLLGSPKNAPVRQGVPASIPAPVYAIPASFFAAHPPPQPPATPFEPPRLP